MRAVQGEPGRGARRGDARARWPPYLGNGIGCAVEVVRGVDRARHALLTSIERLLAGIQSDQAGVELVLFVQVRREAVSVAERTVDDAVRPPIRRLQIVTMEVVSQARHSTADLVSAGDEPLLTGLL